MANEEIDQDEVLALMKGLKAEAKSGFASFKKKLAAGALQDPAVLGNAVEDLFSLVVDLGEMTLNLHTEHMEWSEGIEEEIDALKEGDGGSSLLPTDAMALKTTLLALQQNLRAPVDPSDNVPELLSAKVTETLAFIDAITAEEDDEEEEDDAAPGDDAEGDDETN